MKNECGADSIGIGTSKETKLIRCLCGQGFADTSYERVGRMFDRHLEGKSDRDTDKYPIVTPLGTRDSDIRHSHFTGCANGCAGWINSGDNILPLWEQCQCDCHRGGVADHIRP